MDSLLNRCAGAGHLRDDILYFRKEFEKFTDGDDEERAYLMDMGVKALRLTCFLFIEILLCYPKYTFPHTVKWVGQPAISYP